MEQRFPQIFADLDKRLRDDQLEIDKVNLLLQNGIASVAEVFPNEQNWQIDSVSFVQTRLCAAYCGFIDSVKMQIIAAAGGPSHADSMLPNDLYNRDAVSRVLQKRMGDRPALQDDIGQRTRDLQNSLAENLLKGETIYLNLLTFNYFKENAAFENLGAAGMMAMLSNLQSQAKGTLNIGLNRMLEKMNDIGEIKFSDLFQPAVITPTGGFVLSGERYEADVFLMRYFQKSHSLQIKVNGVKLPLKQGLAHFETWPQHPGRNTYLVETEAITTYLGKWDLKVKFDTARASRTFSFFVGGPPFVQIRAKNSQFLYAGIDNSLHLEAPGITPDSIRVTATGMKLQPLGAGRYLVRPVQPGKASMTVQHPHEAPSVFTFLVRPLPDPLLSLGDSLRGGRVRLQTLPGQKELRVQFPRDFDFQADCKISGFTFTLYRPREDPNTVANTGHGFSPEVLRLLANAQPGDRLVFDDIQVKCTGGQTPQSAQTLSFQIKE